jgi:hypothetical protein
MNLQFNSLLLMDITHWFVLTNINFIKVFATLMILKQGFKHSNNWIYFKFWIWNRISWNRIIILSVKIIWSVYLNVMLFITKPPNTAIQMISKELENNHDFDAQFFLNQLEWSLLDFPPSIHCGKLLCNMLI